MFMLFILCYDKTHFKRFFLGHKKIKNNLQNLFRVCYMLHTRSYSSYSSSFFSFFHRSLHHQKGPIQNRCPVMKRRTTLQIGRSPPLYFDLSIYRAVKINQRVIETDNLLSNSWWGQCTGLVDLGKVWYQIYHNFETKSNIKTIS